MRTARAGVAKAGVRRELRPGLEGRALLVRHVLSVQRGRRGPGRRRPRVVGQGSGVRSNRRCCGQGGMTVAIKKADHGTWHSYTIDGKRAVGVTTALKGIPKDALVPWAAREV